MTKPLFLQILKDHIRTVSGNMLVEFGVCSISVMLFTGLIDRSAEHSPDTHIERNSISAIYSVHLAE